MYAIPFPQLSASAVHATNSYKQSRPVVNRCASAAVHVLPRSVNSSNRPSRFVKFASGGEGPISGPDMPPDMSVSGKASSNEGQMERQMNMQEEQRHDPPITPNPEAASLADKKISPDSGSMAEQRSSMTVQDRTPATEVAAADQSSPMADKMSEGLKAVSEGRAGGQQPDTEPRAEERSSSSGGKTGTDSTSELDKGRL